MINTECNMEGPTFWPEGMCPVQSVVSQSDVIARFLQSLPSRTHLVKQSNATQYSQYEDPSKFLKNSILNKRVTI